MMNEKELKELIAYFEYSSLSALEVEKSREGWRVRLERCSESEEGARVQQGRAPSVSQDPMQGETEADPKPPADHTVQVVKAPVVGIFYEAPSPEEGPFIKVGQMVKEGDTLCLIEAMKMMNELKAPASGQVTSILAENGSLVEFGQPLYEVKIC